MPKDARAASTRSSSTAPNTTTSCRRCARAPWTSHAADAFRYLALTLDRRATLSGFYRRIEYSKHGVV
jgi:hypothetical protein